MSSPNAIETLYAVGHWLLGQTRYRDAAIVFRTMATNAPNDERAWLALGTCHERIGQTLLASELYRLGGEVAAPAVRCAIARARVLRALGRDDEAVELLDFAFQEASDAGEMDLAAIAAAERSAS